MTEDKAEYTAGGKVTPDNAGAAMQLITENYIAQLERTIDGYAMIQGRHADTITEQKRRIAELEQTVQRLEADNKRLRHLDSMPVDAFARYWANSGVPAFGVGYETAEYEADYDAIVEWFNLNGYMDGTHD